MNASAAADAYVRRFALLLANDDTNLTDERAVLRALVSYGADEGGAVAFADRITALALPLRQSRSPDPEARAEIIRRGRIGEIEDVHCQLAVITAERSVLRRMITEVANKAAVSFKREAALRAGITVALSSLNSSLAPNHIAISNLEDAVTRADAMKDATP